MFSFLSVSASLRLILLRHLQFDFLRDLRHVFIAAAGEVHNSLRNSSGVRPAVLAMPPMVMALMGLWRGITSRVLPLLMMMWPLSRAMW
jgi:hypothetical protein